MVGVAPAPTARRRPVDGLFEDIAARHPRSLNGIREARAAAPARYSDLADTFLDWAARAWGRDALPRMVDAFIRFTTGVNMAQARYERAGHYENKTFQDCLNSLYNEKESMDDYLLGVYLTNFLWAHHAEICFRYIDHFLNRIPDARALVEIAPGHGGWGALALKHLPDAELLGYDISPSSIRLATELMTGAGFIDRARYELKDALDLDAVPAESADGVICNFLVEHLERPEKLFAVIRHLLKPGGQAFLTGALTAAQIDHIYEFRHESELVKMAEDAGLRVTDTFSGAPRRTLPNARFLPRSMLLVMQRRRNEIY